MFGQKMMDETADYGSCFESIDDFLNFPVEDVEAGLQPENRSSVPSIWSTNQPESILCSNSVFTSNNSNSDLSSELYVPVSVVFCACIQ